MKAMTVFVAADGSRWDSEEECLAREVDIRECAKVAALLGAPPPDESAFWNGDVFVQHKPSSVGLFRDAVIALLRGTTEAPGPLASYFKEQETKNPQVNWREVHPSWFGRMLDGGSRPHGRLVSRLGCIDKQYREWGQPYYAEHPNATARAVTS